MRSTSGAWSARKSCASIPNTFSALVRFGLFHVCFITAVFFVWFLFFIFLLDTSVLQIDKIKQVLQQAFLTSQQLESAAAPSSSKSNRKSSSGIATRQRRRVIFLNVRELPVKFRQKLEDAWDCEVIDRFSLILQIFSQRAKTRFEFQYHHQLSGELFRFIARVSCLLPNLN